MQNLVVRRPPLKRVLGAVRAGGQEPVPRGRAGRWSRWRGGDGDRLLPPRARPLREERDRACSGVPVAGARSSGCGGGAGVALAGRQRQLNRGQDPLLFSSF